MGGGLKRNATTNKWHPPKPSLEMIIATRGILERCTHQIDFVCVILAKHQHVLPTRFVHSQKTERVVERHQIRHTHTNNSNIKEVGICLRFSYKKQRVKTCTHARAAHAFAGEPATPTPGTRSTTPTRARGARRGGPTRSCIQLLFKGEEK